MLASCQKSPMQQFLDADIEAQIVATNPCDASSACTNSFTKALLRQAQSGDNEVCEALLKRGDGDLAICEGDIRNEKFQPILKACKNQLISRLKDIANRRNRGLKFHADIYSSEKIGLGFTLPTEVLNVDTSQGFFATGRELKPKQVMLTFDDGPEANNTYSILKTLAEVGAKAHFFELGFRAEANPEMTRLVAEEGHSLGNHSWNHPNMQSLSFADAVNQIRQTQSLLLKIVGWVDPFFRFPYGNKTAALQQELNRNQVGNFFWNIDSNDWRMVNEDKTLRSNLQVVNDTIRQLDTQGRGIILMHDIHRRTAELLPELLRLISERGYTLVIAQPENTNLKKHPTMVNKVRLAGTK